MYQNNARSSINIFHHKNDYGTNFEQKNESLPLDAVVLRNEGTNAGAFTFGMKGFAFTLSECSRAFISLASSLVSPGPGSSKESHESGAFVSELLGSIPWSWLFEDILIVQDCNIFFLQWPTRNGAISTPASGALSMLWLNRWQVQWNRRLTSSLRTQTNADVFPAVACRDLPTLTVWPWDSRFGIPAHGHCTATHGKTKSTNKVKNTLKQINCCCCFHLTHIFVSRFKVLLRRG